MSVKSELIDILKGSGKSTTIDGTESILAFFKGEWVEVKLVDIINSPSSYTKATFTANGTINVPAGYVINELVFRNTTANAITGGIRMGTAAAGTQVIVAQAVGANAFIKIADATILLKAFSMTVAQLLYVEAVTAWNSASLEVYIELKRLV